MRRTENGVEHVRVLRDDRGQRLDHHFDPLARREQTKGQHDLALLPPKAALERSRLDKCAIGHAVRDHHDVAPARAVNALKDLAATLGHHDHPRTTAQQAIHHPALVGAGLFEDRVQRDDDGDRHAVEQGEDMLARRAAENAIFVLQPDRLRATGLDCARGIEIRHPVLIGDAARHLGRIIVKARMIVHRIDVDLQIRETALQCGESVGRICCKAAFAGQEIADQREVIDRGHDIRQMHHARNPQSKIGPNAPVLPLPNGQVTIWLQRCCVATR